MLAVLAHDLVPTAEQPKIDTAHRLAVRAAARYNTEAMIAQGRQLSEESRQEPASHLFGVFADSGAEAPRTTKRKKATVRR